MLRRLTGLKQKLISCSCFCTCGSPRLQLLKLKAPPVMDLIPTTSLPTYPYQPHSAYNSAITLHVAVALVSEQSQTFAVKVTGTNDQSLEPRIPFLGTTYAAYRGCCPRDANLGH
jgi:hypothetical protein